MDSQDRNKLKGLKAKFLGEFKPALETLGYNMALGISAELNQPVLEVRLQALPGSPDPIENNLLAQIKNGILPTEYHNLKVNVSYVGYATRRKKRFSHFLLNQ